MFQVPRSSFALPTSRGIWLLRVGQVVGQVEEEREEVLKSDEGELKARVSRRFDIPGTLSNQF